MAQRRPDRARCTIPECPNVSATRGWCARHYKGWQQFGDPLLAVPLKRFRRADAGVARWAHLEDAEIDKSRNGCSVVGCEKLPKKTDHMCPMHRQRHYTYGRVGPALRYTATSDADGWHVDKNGYRARWEGSKKIYEHREIMASLIGRALLGWENVHHKNGLRADNRPDNLELWAKPQYAGQRVEDVIDFVVENYLPQLVERLDLQAHVADQ